jgi:predicted ABC-class ATPase
MLVPPEAVSFNSLVEKQTRLDEKYSDPEIEGIIADLEAQARMVLTPEELKATMEPFNQTIKDVDSYVGGLNQAFVCWKNG